MIQKKNRERGRGRKSMLKQVRQDIQGRNRVVWESSLYFFSNFPGYTLNHDKIVSYQKMKRIWELKLERITLNAFILLTSAFPSSAQSRILLAFCRSTASAPPASPHWRGRSVPTGWEGPELPLGGRCPRIWAEDAEGGKMTPQGCKATAFSESRLTWLPYLDFLLPLLL